MERKPCERTRDALLDLPSVCLSWSFVVDVMLCSNVGNAIFDKGYIKNKWYHLIDAQINIQNMILPHVK